MLAISKAARHRTPLLGAVLGILLVAAAAGCGGAQKPQADSAAASESTPNEASVGEAPECVDDKDQRISCLADADCCAGFVCGKDPELSPRVSYCIYGG